eukprot:6491157-Amphidinium_carterae.1
MASLKTFAEVAESDATYGWFHSSCLKAVQHSGALSKVVQDPATSPLITKSLQAMEHKGLDLQSFLKGAAIRVLEPIRGAEALLSKLERVHMAMG